VNVVADIVVREFWVEDFEIGVVDAFEDEGGCFGLLEDIDERGEMWVALETIHQNHQTCVPLPLTAPQ
jgi:hypothetical protein